MPDDFDYSAAPRRRPRGEETPPFITIILIALCVVLTAIYHLSLGDKTGPLYKISHIVLLTPEQIWGGHYLGLFTSFFIHLDMLHLAFNMYWTWYMGSTLERTIPAWKYLLFVIVSTMVGSCCELLISGQTGAGASGAGYALMGLLWAGRGYHASWRNLATEKNMQMFLVWGVLCIVLTATGSMAVANGAHFGGLLFGLTIGHLFFAPRRKPVWAGALVFLAAACVISLTWMPWSSGWNWYKGGRALNKGRYQEAITYYNRALRTGGHKGPLLYNIALARYLLLEEALRSKQLQDNRILEKMDADFNTTLAAANAAAPPSSDPHDATGDPKLNHLNESKAQLDQVFSPDPRTEQKERDPAKK